MSMFVFGWNTLSSYVLYFRKSGVVNNKWFVCLIFSLFCIWSLSSMYLRQSIFPTFPWWITYLQIFYHWFYVLSSRVSSLFLKLDWLRLINGFTPDIDSYHLTFFGQINQVAWCRFLPWYVYWYSAIYNCYANIYLSSLNYIE
jgi:hypothetical protein